MATVFNLGKGRGAATVLDPSGAVLTYLQGLPVNATAGSHVAGVGSQFVIENVGTRWLISPRRRGTRQDSPLRQRARMTLAPSIEDLRAYHEGGLALNETGKERLKA